MSEINDLLNEAKLDNTCKRTVPSGLSTENKELLRTLVTILQPMADWTDSLQSDGITSSLVIVGLLSALHSNTKNK